jgi:transcriptional regulator with XRE-family HTH domain
LRESRPHGHAALRVGMNAPPAAGRDSDLGNIFRNMRAALRLTREAVARRLATTPGTIEDLENGNVALFPHWRETTRIVRSYCELLRLDPEPLLWRIQGQLQQVGGYEEPTTGPRTARPPAPPALLRGGRVKSAREPRRRARRTRRLFAFSAPLMVIAAAMYGAHVAPAPIYRGITVLPAPFSGMARAVMDNFLLIFAPRREGLRWIDIGDPQLRKVDKLQTTTR